MSSDKPISSAANSARLKVNPEDDFLDDSGRAETIPVEREYVSLNSSRLRANPEDVFLDDGGQIEYQQTTAATAKKNIHKDLVNDPTTTYDLFDDLSSVEHGASGAEQSVPMSDRTAAGSQA